MSFRPFLVADRPSAFRIIRGAMPDLAASGLGIMTHANVTENVAGFIRSFPSSGGFYPRNDSFEADDERYYVTETGELKDLGTRIQHQTTIICDSGAFQKEGTAFDSYEKLFRKYQKLGVDYGIINDQLNDSKGTLDEAHEAIDVYQTGQYQFDLVGVAQGKSVEEYLDCYDRLRELGYEKVGVGGLLSKTGNRSGKFAQVSDTTFMERVLREIRKENPESWLFALGCHHPSRHHLFDQLQLAGADYKGWLFKYQPQFIDQFKARKWRFQELRSFLKQNIFPRQVGSPASRLLILQLNNKSTSGKRLQAAQKRNYGPYMGVVRSWRHEKSAQTEDVDIVFVSERYGLIPGSCRLPPIQERNTSRIHSCQGQALRADIASYLRYRKYSEILVAGNTRHRERCLPIEVIERLESSSRTSIEYTSGTLGEQQSQLREWLQSEISANSTFEVSAQVQ